MAEDKKMPEVIEEMKRVLRKAGLTEGDITEAIASISTMQEVTPIHDGEQYRAYEERYHKMMQDAGFVGQKRGWEEYMDYVRTPAGRLALAIFNRMAEWKAAKGVP
jgi:ubiquinone/menaquinone biosynthesis C-methylase UbiE